jgi:hypothetical protein
LNIRTKSNGAYAIRKYYPERLRNAFYLYTHWNVPALSRTCSAAEAFPFCAEYSYTKVDGPIIVNIFSKRDNVYFSPKQQKKVKSEGTNYVVSNNKTETNPDPKTEPAPSTQGTDVTDGATASPTGSLTIAPPVDPPPSTPVLFASVMPEFDKLEGYLTRHIIYPQRARELV